MLRKYDNISVQCDENSTIEKVNEEYHMVADECVIDEKYRRKITQAFSKHFNINENILYNQISKDTSLKELLRIVLTLKFPEITDREFEEEYDKCKETNLVIRAFKEGRCCVL